MIYKETITTNSDEEVIMISQGVAGEGDIVTETLYVLSRYDLEQWNPPLLCPAYNILHQSSTSHKQHYTSSFHSEKVR